MYKATLNMEITRDGNKQKEDITIEGSIGLLMAGICKVLIDIENTLPEEERASFRRDFLTALNERRKEVYEDVNT